MTDLYLRATDIKGNLCTKSIAVERNFSFLTFECQKSKAWKAVLVKCGLVSGVASSCCL